MSEAVAFVAAVHEIKTTTDGGWRISFDVPDSESLAMLHVSALRDMEIRLEVSTNAGT